MNVLQIPALFLYFLQDNPNLYLIYLRLVGAALGQIEFLQENITRFEELLNQT